MFRKKQKKQYQAPQERLFFWLAIVFVGYVIFANERDLPVREASEDKTISEASALGLRVFDRHVGRGKEGREGEEIALHYSGYKVDGAPLPVAVEGEATPPFTLVFTSGKGEVIAGLEQGVMGNESVVPMRVGGKRLLIIPPDLLNRDGSGRKDSLSQLLFPENEVVLFEVELVEVK